MTPSSTWGRIALGVLGSGVIALFAWRRGSLAPSGAWAALALGTLITLGGGAAWFGVLVAFFATSTLLGKVGKRRKEAVKKEFSKGDTRDVWQALANGGVAALAAAGAWLLPSPLWAGAFLGAMATANGDTWATEIGVLSKREPISLVRLTRVPRGTSGAVSGLGMAATMAGALVVGLVAAIAPGSFSMGSLRIVAIAVVSGTIGALADSLLGATLQAGYWCDGCGKGCEAEVHHCGRQTKLARGLAWLDNDGVNALATLAGAGVGAALTGSWSQ